MAFSEMNRVQSPNPLIAGRGANEKFIEKFSDKVESKSPNRGAGG